MIVISDTTPLISLLKINRIDLLEKLFGDVLIPQAVFDELTSDKRFQVEADQICQKEFIFVKRVNVPESVHKYQTEVYSEYFLQVRVYLLFLMHPAVQTMHSALLL